MLTISVRQAGGSHRRTFRPAGSGNTLRLGDGEAVLAARGGWRGEEAVNVDYVLQETPLSLVLSGRLLVYGHLLTGLDQSVVLEGLRVR